MNLKTAVAADQKPAVFPMAASVNRLRHPRHHRHHRLLRYRRLLRRYRHRSRSDCPKGPKRNRRHRTNEKGSSRRRRHSRRRPLRSRQMILDWRGGSAIASSAGNKSAMFRRPQFRMPPLRSSSFSLAPKIGLCAAKIPQDSQYWSRNVAAPFIDHSSEMWNLRQWNASSAVPAP
jgi:hypothetical protein